MGLFGFILLVVITLAVGLRWKPSLSELLLDLIRLQLVSLVHPSSAYFSWVTKHCIQSCHAANATIAPVITKVTYSITLFQNLFCLLVISCTNIAIFFFSLSLPSSIYCTAMQLLFIFLLIIPHSEKVVTLLIE